MEEGPTRDFINKVANAVPQIKLKDEDVEEDEELSISDQEAEDIWNGLPVNEQ
jgi:hypothetical protein